MSFPDTVPTLHVSSTRGVCRISGPPEIKPKIAINHTDLTLIKLLSCTVFCMHMSAQNFLFSQLHADCTREMAPMICMMAAYRPL